MALRPPWEKQRKLVQKAVDETDPAYGLEPAKRSLEQQIEYGFVNVDKQAGPTSHDVTASVRRLMRAERAGHSGTLEEPRAPGRSRCDRRPARGFERGDEGP